MACALYNLREESIVKSRSFALNAVLLAAVTLTPLTAQPVVIDPDSAVEMARANNLSLRQARIDLGTRQRERDTSWNRFLPSLSAGTSLSRSIPQPTLVETPWGLSASLSTGLPLSPSSVQSIRAAELEYQTQALSLERTEKQLERDIRKAFYQLLLRLENIRLLEQSLETAGRRYERVSTNYEFGLASELDKLNAQVNLENLKPELARARTDYQAALMSLKQELGLGRAVELVLEGDIATEGVSLEAQRLIREHAEGRLDIQALQHRLAVLENQRKLAATQEFSPQLALSFSLGARQADPFQAAKWSEPGLSRSSSLGISLSVPLGGLLPSSSSRVRLAGIDDSIARTNLELAQAREQGEIRIETLVLNLERSRLSIEVLEKNAALAARVYELTEREYEAGLTDLLTLAESYDSLQQARLRVLTEQYNYRSLLLDLEYELNTSLRD